MGVKLKNLLKSFWALHWADQGGDGGVVQLQTLKESRLQYIANENSGWINELEEAVDGLTSRMVVSTVFESPPSSPERPSREVMLPLCWSKRAPTWFTADEQSEVSLPKLHCKVMLLWKVTLLPTTDAALKRLNCCLLKYYNDAEKIRLLPSEGHCRHCRPCPVLARPRALAGRPHPVVDQVPATERTMILHLLLANVWSQRLLSFLHNRWVHMYLYMWQFTCWIHKTTAKARKIFRDILAFFSKSENFPFIQLLVWWSIFHFSRITKIEW